MLQKIFGLLKLPFVRVGLLLAGLVLVGGALWLFSRTQVPPAQPIEFPHDKHLQWGIQCLYCHPGALRGSSAGLPTQAKCWGCHQQIARSTPALDTLRGYVERGEPIPWVPVALLPDFVHFTHRPHVAAGLNCETCHGDLSHATVYENPQVMNMGWCLACHRTRSEGNPEIRTRLLDCATCHY
jgi:hypothetical protein